MNRRQFLAVTGALSLAGCTSTNTGTLSDRSTTDGSGGLIAEDVANTPDDATVIDATSGKLSTVDEVQTVISRAAESDNSYALLKLPPDVMADIEEALSDLPQYFGDAGPSGYYLKYNDNPILLYLFYTKN